jgi:hypothetical protein
MNFKSLVKTNIDKRSSNILYDRNEEIINSYIVNDRTNDLLIEILNCTKAGTRTRSYSLIGPYGTGKSSFISFLLSLASKDKELSNMAINRLHKKTIKNKIESLKELNFPKGFVLIPILSSNETLRESLINVLLETSEIKKNKKILEKLLKNDKNQVVDSVIMEAIRYITSTKPALLVIDEFGKNLERISKDSENSELNLIQQIAEFSSRDNKNQLILITVQHANFTSYFYNANSEKIREWAKVQGRFQELNIVDSNKDLINNITSYIDCRANASIDNISKKIQEECRKLKITFLNEYDFSLLKRAFPLHPTTLLALPVLSSMFGQNGRTVFSFLSGKDKYSLSSHLDKVVDQKSLVYAHDLYDYFSNSIRSLVSTSSEHSKWFEMEHKITKFSGDDYELKLLKTIAVLNLTYSSLKIKSNLANITFSINQDLTEDGLRQTKKALGDLTSEGILIERKFAGEYRLWEGSDFDIEGEIKKQKLLISSHSHSEILNLINYKKIVVSSKNTYISGFFRYFDLFFVDSKNAKTVFKTKGSEGAICICLEPDFDKIVSLLNIGQNIVIGKTTSNKLIIKLAYEYKATLDVLNRLLLEDSKDNVAKNELKTRVEQLYIEITSHLSSVLHLNKSEIAWYAMEDDRSTFRILKDFNSLTSLTSYLLEIYHPKSPKNAPEMMSKNTITSQAAKARLTLLTSMLKSNNIECFGLTGDGPAVSLYKTLIFENNIHRKVGREWILSKPSVSSSTNILPAWEHIEKYFKKEAKLSIHQIAESLQEKPYGCKYGYALTLVVFVLIKNINSLVIYEDGVYVSEFTSLHLERMLKVPHKFNTKYIATKTSSYKVIHAISEVLNISGSMSESAKLLRVVSKIVSMVKNLPQYTLNSLNHSESQKRLIIEIKNAVDPVKLLCEGIPNIYNQYSIKSDTGVYNIAICLKSDLDGLTKYYNLLINELITSVCGMRSEQTPKSFVEKYSASAKETINKVSDPKLRLLLGTILRPYEEDSEWIENMSLAISGKVPRLWKDYDKNEFIQTVTSLVNQWVRVESLDIKVIGENGQLVTLTTGSGEDYILAASVDRNDLRHAGEIYNKLIMEHGENKIQGYSSALIRLLVENTSNSTVKENGKGAKNEK